MKNVDVSTIVSNSVSNAKKVIEFRFVNPADICIRSNGKNIVIPEIIIEKSDGGRVSFLPID